MYSASKPSVFTYSPVMVDRIGTRGGRHGSWASAARNGSRAGSM